MIPNILAGEGTNFCVFSRYLSLLARGLLQKTILQQPLGYISAGRPQGVKGGGTPLALPLTPCGMAAIARPWFLFPWPPDASCSCISCCPTGFPQHNAAGRTPALVPNSRPGKRPLPWFCAGSLGSDAQWRCLFGSSSSVRMESHSRSGFPQCQPLLSLTPPASDSTIPAGSQRLADEKRRNPVGRYAVPLKRSYVASESTLPAGLPDIAIPRPPRFARHLPPGEGRALPRRRWVSNLAPEKVHAAALKYPPMGLASGCNRW